MPRAVLTCLVSMLAFGMTPAGAQHAAAPDSQAVEQLVPALLAPAFSDLTENRANRVLHFALELGVWGAGGAWGYEQASGIGGIGLAAAVPLATVFTWTAFSVPGDPWLPGGRNGTQPRKAIPGWLRLTYELGVHGLSVWALRGLGWDAAGAVMAGGTALHYSVSYQRVAWLLGRRK